MMIALAGGPAMAPDLVAGRYLATANALETLSFTLAGVLAPPVAGFLIARIGAPNVILVDVLSYVIFAWALANITLSTEHKPQAQVEKQSYGLKDAVQLLLKNKVLLSTTLMQGTTPIGGVAAGLLLPVLGIPVMIAFSAVLIGFPGLLGYGVKALRGENNLSQAVGDPA